MTQPWSPDAAPAWRWLKETWTCKVPKTAHARTHLDSLRGVPVTEACRWEEDYWELFAGVGPDVPDDQTRIVPLWTLIGADNSLTPVLDLPVGEGIWREGDSDWHIWQSSKETGDAQV
jgi:hypothetical protein